MMNVPSFGRIGSAALILGSLSLSTQAQAAILAAWDNWADTGADGIYDADSTLTGFTASIASQSNRINGGWSSTDGTYGNLAGAPTTANGAFLTNATGSALTMTYTLTNNTGEDYNIESFNFDFAPRDDSSDPVSKGPNAFELTYENGGLEPDDTEIANVTDRAYYLSGSSSDPNANSNYPDYSYSLSSLSSIVLADGESAIFTLVFSGSSGPNSSNISSMVDNVAFSGSTIPEPSTYAALLGLMTLAFVCRRRAS